MSSKNAKPRMNLALLLGIMGLVTSMGSGLGYAAADSCGGDSAFVTFKFDSLLAKRMDTAQGGTLLGFQVFFHYPSQSEITRITDSCNREDAQCMGPDSILVAYWKMLGSKLLDKYELNAFPPSAREEGLEITDGSIVSATQSDILAISQECYVSLVRAFPGIRQDPLGLRLPDGQIRVPYGIREYNLLGRKLRGTPDAGQSFSIPLHAK